MRYARKKEGPFYGLVLGPSQQHGTENGPGKWSLFFELFAVVLSISVLPMPSMANAWWRWSNCPQSRDAPGRPRVLMNIDETNVKLAPQERGVM